MYSATQEYDLALTKLFELLEQLRTGRIDAQQLDLKVYNEVIIPFPFVRKKWDTVRRVMVEAGDLTPEEFRVGQMC